MGAPWILEQEDVVRFRWSQIPILFLVFAQLLNETSNDVGVAYVGFLLWMMSCHTPQQPVGSLKGNQERYDPLKSIKLEL
jgi:hypothetical protein